MKTPLLEFPDPTICDRMVVELTTRVKRISNTKKDADSDPVRFQLVIMNQILVRLIQRRSNAQISSIPTGYEMEDSAEAREFFLFVRDEFERNALSEAHRTWILCELYENISRQTMPKVTE